MLALEAPASARDLAIVGVYLRVLRTSNGIEFCVAECQFSTEQKSIDSLEVRTAERFVLRDEPVQSAGQ
jgi:hypothetical protein